MSTVRPIATFEELLEASGHHPVVELDVGRGFAPPGWAAALDGAGAVAFPRRSDHGVPGASVLGDGPAIDVLLADPRVRSWFAEGDFRHLSRPREHHDLVDQHLPLDGAGGDWDWLWTRDLPPADVPGEDRVVVLEPAEGLEATALLALASPRTHGQPFARPGQLWMGVHDGTGALVACGGSEPSGAGTPTLAGIAVAPTARRQGLGAAVTAALTRRAVAATGACALGMFADNDAARRVYRRLGYRTGMRWRSRWRAGALPPPPKGS